MTIIYICIICNKFGNRGWVCFQMLLLTFLCLFFFSPSFSIFIKTDTFLFFFWSVAACWFRFHQCWTVVTRTVPQFHDVWITFSRKAAALSSLKRRSDIFWLTFAMTYNIWFYSRRCYMNITIFICSQYNTVIFMANPLFYTACIWHFLHFFWWKKKH